MAARYVTIRKAAEETGYTEDAIRSKIRDGVWLHGHEFVIAPDGRTLIDMEGYEKWAEAEVVSAQRRKRPSKSASPTRASAAGRGSSSSPPPLT